MADETNTWFRISADGYTVATEVVAIHGRHELPVEMRHKLEARLNHQMMEEAFGRLVREVMAPPQSEPRRLSPCRCAGRIVCLCGAVSS